MSRQWQNPFRKCANQKKKLSFISVIDLIFIFTDKAFYILFTWGFAIDLCILWEIVNINSNIFTHFECQNVIFSLRFGCYLPLILILLHANNAQFRQHVCKSIYILMLWRIWRGIKNPHTIMTLYVLTLWTGHCTQYSWFLTIDSFLQWLF